MVCELLAIKLLKEYSTRELIDALSYDFLPLQSQTPPQPSGGGRGGPMGWGDHRSYRGQRQLRAVRISCLEIAIRAQAKRFLAHPLVVQHLEAIWAGTIVFHSAADNLHRQPTTPGPSSRASKGYGSFVTNLGTSSSGAKSIAETSAASFRRTASLYNPRDASLFKLSRLRVPRYRQVLSTLSFATLLGLFLAVIRQRSLGLTTLELVFWFWSAGYMLDEIVGFNEQGFSLYLMSFWNTFDVGILLLLVGYYCLRIYSVAIPRPPDKDLEVANLAYDVLATSAVLLVPRLFSVLDHYRYFSQLLIATRMMLTDLLAVLVLIIIACSGFFVAFTSSFGSDNSARSIAYALFQMLMGYTPAAWELWDNYNMLGKAILTLFLFICHFLVVTILITVLTNSFMAIVRNANEEHQFVFAVNTISMVKSDALFSYVAPTNIVAWAIAPLRFVMPFRTFIRLNRTIIKATHFPILFTIYLYERVVLRSALFEPTDLVEGSGRPTPGGHWPERYRQNHRFDTTRRAREPSIATQKDRALDEVFRGAHQSRGQQRSSNEIDSWMQNMGPETEPPEEQDRDVVEELEQTRPSTKARLQRHPRFQARAGRNFTETTRSAASDPEEYPAQNTPHARRRPYGKHIFTPETVRNLTQHTDVDGDDELSTNDEDSSKSKQSTGTGSSSNSVSDNQRSLPIEQWSSTTVPAPAFDTSRPSTAKLASRKNSPSRRPRTPHHHHHGRHHARTASSATVLYNPVDQFTDDGMARGEAHKDKHNRSPKAPSGATTPTRRRPLKGPPPAATQTRPRSIPFPSSVPDIPAALSPDDPLSAGQNRRGRQPSIAMGLGSDLGDNKAVGGGFVGALPASFTTQMAHIRRRQGHVQGGRGGGRGGGGIGVAGGGGSAHDNRDMLSKLVLARMKTLEEGFQDLVDEVKDMRRRPARQQQQQQQRPQSALPGSAAEVRTTRPAPPPRRKSERDVVRAISERKTSGMKAFPSPDLDTTTTAMMWESAEGDVSDAAADLDESSEFKASSV